MKINIANFRLYSPSELRSYAEKGLLSFDGIEDHLISEAILYMLEGLYTDHQLEQEKSRAYSDGYDCGYAEGLAEPDELWTTVK